MNEIHLIGPKQNYTFNKTNVDQIDNNCSLDILGLKDFGPENSIGLVHVLVVIDNFSKKVSTKLLKKNNA